MFFYKCREETILQKSFRIDFRIYTRIKFKVYEIMLRSLYKVTDTVEKLKMKEMIIRI